MNIDGKQYLVRDLMRVPVLIQESVTLKEALKALVDGKSNMGCVVNAEGMLVGGVSTLDVIRAVLPDYLESDAVAARFADNAMLLEDATKAANTSLAKFINRDEATVAPDTQLLEATVISSRDCNGRIIVVDADRKPVGVLTRTEIKQVLAAFLGVRNELKEACEGDGCKD